MLSFRIETVRFLICYLIVRSSVVRLTSSERRRQGQQQKEKEGLIALKRPKHALKSKDFRLNVHGTKGRCELCIRVGESLYSAPFFCGSYFLLLTRVLYLEPPSFRMPAKRAEKCVFKTQAYFKTVSEKKSYTTHVLREHHLPRDQEGMGLYSYNPAWRDTKKRESECIWSSCKWSTEHPVEDSSPGECFLNFFKKQDFTFQGQMYVKEVTGSLTHFVRKLLSFLAWVGCCPQDRTQSDTTEATQHE